MAKTMVEVLVDDLDGSEGAESVQLGWNGEWREVDLSRRNLASLSKVFDKFWNAGQPVTADRGSRSGNQTRSKTTVTTSPRATKSKRDPKAIRAWATDNGIAIPARGRIPTNVESRYKEANGNT